MRAFLIRRFLGMVATLLVVSIVVFGMSRLSGNPLGLLLDPYATKEQEEQLTRKLGLDKPLYQQYGIYMGNVLTGDFGRSISYAQPVMDVLQGRIWATVKLGLAAFGFSLIVGVPLGVFSAVNRGRVLDQVAKIVALIGQSAPPFWLGIMLIFLFAVKLKLLPPSGQEGGTSIILPAVTLGWFFVAANMRLVRSAMLDVLNTEYIKLAKAKGVSRRGVIWNHALRNAVIPPLTFAGITMGTLVTGSMVTETVFAWPGLGQLAFRAVTGADYPLLQGVVIIFTLMYVGAAFLVDVLYAYVDPRIRYA